MISISAADQTIDNCKTVIIVPTIAENEPGYIKVLTASIESGSKHEFHALAQMAYFQVQDDELNIELMHGQCSVVRGNDVETVESGLVIYRRQDGVINVIAHHNIPHKKLLEVANRYCTRWVRLDI